MVLILFLDEDDVQFVASISPEKSVKSDIELFHRMVTIPRFDKKDKTPTVPFHSKFAKLKETPPCLTSSTLLDATDPNPDSKEEIQIKMPNSYFKKDLEEIKMKDYKQFKNTELSKCEYAYRLAERTFESKQRSVGSNPSNPILRELRRSRDQKKDEFIKMQQKVRDLEFQLFGHSTLKSEGYAAGSKEDDTLVSGLC